MHSVVLLVLVIVLAVGLTAAGFVYAVPEDTAKRWTGEWWQWVLSINETNVLVDPNGTQIMKHQPQDAEAYFLTGAYNSNITRNVTVSAGKPILIPVLNGIQVCVDCSFFKQMFGLRDELIAAENINDNVVFMEAQIDGKPLTYTRITSDVFELPIVENNVIYILNQTGKIGKAVSEGYWAILEDLEPGMYKIHTHGVLPDYSSNVYYNLLVK